MDYREATTAPKFIFAREEMNAQTQGCGRSCFVCGACVCVRVCVYTLAAGGGVGCGKTNARENNVGGVRVDRQLRSRGQRRPSHLPVSEG